MTPDQFDTLTRQLAQTMTRRQALRLMLGLAAGGIAAHFGFLKDQKLDAYAQDTCQALSGIGRCSQGWTKQGIPGYVPTKNGCGPQSWWIRYIQPPQGYGRASFYDVCNDHDLCYQDCSVPKSTCDTN